MSNGVLLVVMFLAGLAAGLVWGLIPAVFKAFLNTNETLFTLMMNYVAMQIVTFCIVFWENPEGSNTVGIINAPTQAGWLPALGEWTYGWNVIIIMAITLLMYFYLKYSKQGYEIAVVGESENTALYAGISVKKSSCVQWRFPEQSAELQVSYWSAVQAIRFLPVRQAEEDLRRSSLHGCQNSIPLQ